VPPMTRLAQMLRERGLDIRPDTLTINEMSEEVKRLAHHA